MFLYILLGLVILIWFVWYMGFHKPIVVKQKRLDKRYALYREYTANYSKDMAGIFKGFLSEIRPVFPDNISFGVFYDNPRELKDQSKARTVVGIYIDESEISKAQSFTANNNQYRFKDLPEMDCVYTTSPYKNALSILWAVIRIYPALFNYLTQNKLIEDYEKETDGVVDNHYWRGSSRTTEYLIPFGKNIKQYSLTSLPEPERKAEFLKKTE